MADDIFPLPRQLVGDGDLFLMKVFGDDRLEDSGIADGDWAIVRRQVFAVPGESVAILHQGDATIAVAGKVPDGANMIGRVVAILRASTQRERPASCSAARPIERITAERN